MTGNESGPLARHSTYGRMFASRIVSQPARNGSLGSGVAGGAAPSLVAAPGSPALSAPDDLVVSDAPVDIVAQGFDASDDYAVRVENGGPRAAVLFCT